MLGRTDIDLQTNDPDRARVVAAARLVFDAAVDSSLKDDRFDSSWEADVLQPATQMWTSVGYADTVPVAYLGGLVDDDHVLRLEALYDAEIIDPAGVFRAQLDALHQSIDERHLGPATAIELWAKPAPEWLDQVAEESGFAPFRGLYQMRRPLPVDDIVPVATRSFVPADTEPLRLVNNRSFAEHPAQGNQSAEDWNAMVAEPWFRGDGTRIYESPEGVIAGYCITKIHSSPPLGEIYVIGLDPSVHGQGLGGPMTASGLDWLARQGLQVAMLYVEADNEPAIRTYKRLGFDVVRSDRSWRLDLDRAPDAR